MTCQKFTMLCCDVLQRDDKLMAALNVLPGFWGFSVLYSKASGAWITPCTG